jgi:hypothetical protein
MIAMEPYERKAIEDLVLNVRAMAQLLSNEKPDNSVGGDHSRKLMILSDIVECWLEKVDENDRAG